MSKWLQINSLRQWIPRIIVKQQIYFQPRTINGQKDEAESLITSMEDQGSISAQSWTRSSIMVEKAAIRINLETRSLVWKKRTRNLGSSKEYRVASYPVQVKGQTNLDQAKLKVAANKTVTLKKDAVTDLGLSITIQKKWNWLLKQRSECHF